MRPITSLIYVLLTTITVLAAINTGGWLVDLIAIAAWLQGMSLLYVAGFLNEVRR